jgi:glycerol kinase
MIFDHSGRDVAKHQLEHEQILPQAGWVEHDAREIWRRTQEVIDVTFEKSGISPSDVVAIGITNQRETTLVWDKNTGEPYYNALVWQDTRTDKIVHRLSENGGPDRFRDKTGLPISTYFSGTKLIWLLENVDGLREAAEAGDAIFGNMDTWLIWQMTGNHITDVTNASRTLLMNLETLDWDDEILAELDIPRQMLPEIRPSSDPNFYGVAEIKGAKIPVCGDLGDQQAATYGQTCFSPGEAKNTYGTGNFLLLNTGTDIVHSENGMLTTVCYQIGDQDPVYALEGSIAVTGSLVQWLRDNLGIFEFSEHVEEYARKVEDNGGVYFVPAFSGLFAPYWRDDARGVIVGMTRYNNKYHLCRAALEATAYQTRDVVEAMNADSGVPLESLKVDGGMVVNDLLMQFQSDILDVPVIRPQVTETTALGAAYAAGLAVDFWSTEQEMRDNWQVDKTWEPDMDDERREELYDKWKKAVTRTFDWVE